MSSISSVIKEIQPVAEFSAQQRPRSNKLLAAFDEAIRDGDLEMAAASLRLAEISIMFSQPGSMAMRGEMDELVAGYAYLWMLRHPDARAA